MCVCVCERVCVSVCVRVLMIFLRVACVHVYFACIYMRSITHTWPVSLKTFLFFMIDSLWYFVLLLLILLGSRYRGRIHLEADQRGGRLYINWWLPGDEP